MLKLRMVLIIIMTWRRAPPGKHRQPDGDTRTRARHRGSAGDAGHRPAPGNAGGKPPRARSGSDGNGHRRVRRADPERAFRRAGGGGSAALRAVRGPQLQRAAPLLFGGGGRARGVVRGRPGRGGDRAGLPRRPLLAAPQLARRPHPDAGRDHQHLSRASRPSTASTVRTSTSSSFPAPGASRASASSASWPPASPISCMW